MTLEHPTQQRPLRQLSPTQPKPHRRTELIVDAFTAAVCERWGTFKARRNHTVIAIVEALAGLPTFAAGGRAAYPAEKLARRCHRHVRTVEDAVAKLREFPDLVQVVLVRKGEPDWKGARCRLAHLEFQVGSALRELIEHPPTGAATNLPGVTAGVPQRHAGNTPGLTSGDLISAQLTDLQLQLQREPAPLECDDQLNFANQHYEQIPTPPPETQSSPLPPIHTATDHPEATSPPPPAVAEQPTVDSESLVTARAVPLVASRTEPPGQRRPALALVRGRSPAPLAGQRNARLPGATSRGDGSCHRRSARLAPPATPPDPDEPALELRFPCWLLDAVIRQHRAIAEGKGPYIPINDAERSRVDGALAGLPGRWEDDALLELCARVSDGALRDARAKGGTVANLRYTFGGPDEEPEQPHKHFHRRVAELREDDEKSARERQDGELAAALFGGRPPLNAYSFTPHPAAQRQRPARSVVSRRTGGDPLTPAELLMNIEQFTARHHSQRVARTA